MKKSIFFSLLIGIALALVISTSGKLFSQTSGTFSFTVNPVSHSGYDGTFHYVAIWIENSAAGFVKTKLKRADNHGTTNHLLVWKAKSLSNTTDAITGASLSTYAPITITWNGTDVPAALVPDGNYTVWVECTWNHGTTGTSTTSVQFTKGPVPVSLTPPNTTNFTGMSLTWTPLNVGIQNPVKNEGTTVYPNPSNGIINIDFKQALNGKIQVFNTVGAKIYEEKIEISNPGIKTYDISKFANGTYFVNIQNEDSKEVEKLKVILNK